MEPGGGFGGIRGEAGRRRAFFDDFGSRLGGILESIAPPGDAMCPQMVHFWVTGGSFEGFACAWKGEALIPPIFGGPG